MNKNNVNLNIFLTEINVNVMHQLDEDRNMLWVM